MASATSVRATHVTFVMCAKATWKVPNNGTVRYCGAVVIGSAFVGIDMDANGGRPAAGGDRDWYASNQPIQVH
jgi:hypothetical protein